MVLFGMRIKQLVGFPAFFGLFLIVFSAYIVDNLSGFVAMHGKFVIFGMRDETAKLDYYIQDHGFRLQRRQSRTKPDKYVVLSLIPNSTMHACTHC